MTGQSVFEARVGVERCWMLWEALLQIVDLAIKAITGLKVTFEDHPEKMQLSQFFYRAVGTLKPQVPNGVGESSNIIIDRKPAQKHGRNQHEYLGISLPMGWMWKTCVLSRILADSVDLQKLRRAINAPSGRRL